MLKLELRMLDGMDKVNSKSLNADYLVKNFLNEQSKVSFHFYTDKVSKQVKWHDLIGAEKLRLLSNNFLLIFQSCFQISSRR